jgi:hypothetical protein
MMFLRKDAEAINAAARAFSRSSEVKTGVARWPGTVHIEAAVDAYLQARGIGDIGRAPDGLRAAAQELVAKSDAQMLKPVNEVSRVEVERLQYDLANALRAATSDMSDRAHALIAEYYEAARAIDGATLASYDAARQRLKNVFDALESYIIYLESGGS